MKQTRSYLCWSPTSSQTAVWLTNAEKIALREVQHYFPKVGVVSGPGLYNNPAVNFFELHHNASRGGSAQKAEHDPRFSMVSNSNPEKDRGHVLLLHQKLLGRARVRAEREGEGTFAIIGHLLFCKQGIGGMPAIFQTKELRLVAA